MYSYQASQALIYRIYHTSDHHGTRDLPAKWTPQGGPLCCPPLDRDIPWIFVFPRFFFRASRSTGRCLHSPGMDGWYYHIGLLKTLLSVQFNTKISFSKSKTQTPPQPIQQKLSNNIPKQDSLKRAKLSEANRPAAPASAFRPCLSLCVFAISTCSRGKEKRGG